MSEEDIKRIVLETLSEVLSGIEAETVVNNTSDPYDDVSIPVYNAYNLELEVNRVLSELDV